MSGVVEPKAEDRSRRAAPPSRLNLLFRLVTLPIFGLITLMFRTKKESAGLRSEARRLDQSRRTQLAVMDRYLDSRDHADDDEPKERMLDDIAGTGTPDFDRPGGPAERRRAQ